MRLRYIALLTLNSEVQILST